ncbi:hypothetical protein BGX20_007013, partial [Mortierella sp. AD010]
MRERKRQRAKDIRLKGPQWQERQRLRKRNQERKKRAKERRRLQGNNKEGTEAKLKRLAREQMDREPTMRRILLRKERKRSWEDATGVSVPPDALKQLEGKDKVIIYSDGSMRDVGKEDVSMAFGVVYQDTEVLRTA